MSTSALVLFQTLSSSSIRFRSPSFQLSIRDKRRRSYSNCSVHVSLGNGEGGRVKASICPEEETCGSIGSDLDAMIKNIKQAKKAREQQETGKKGGNNKKGISFGRT